MPERAEPGVASPKAGLQESSTLRAIMAETPRIDWDAITEEATQLLSDYIRIDTSNPPGREKAADALRGNAAVAEGLEQKLREAGANEKKLPAATQAEAAA